MPGLSGADEVVIGRIHRFQDRQPRGFDQAVHPLLRCDAAGVRGSLHLGAVLVGAGQEPDILSALTMPAGQEIASRRRIRVTDVRGIVDVVDRRCRIETSRWIRRSHGAILWLARLGSDDCVVDLATANADFSSHVGNC